jgi:hypothetical protein
MSYDLLIEHPEGETFQRATVEAAIAKFPQLRKRDAESYRSAATELILTAEKPHAPVDSLTLRLTYRELPGSFDGGCDIALGLASELGARVVDSQLGETVTAATRAASREKATQVAIWSKRLGNEFEQPEKPFVDGGAVGASAPNAPGAGRGGDRPWWKFWARE